MKINLSKEYIEKACELIEGYSMRIDDSSRGDFKEHLRYRGYRDNIKDANTPQYRDFLQLVIEGINKRSWLDYYIKTDPWYIYVFNRNAQDSANNIMSFPIATGTTEAKEKAISFVFNNMSK